MFSYNGNVVFIGRYDCVLFRNDVSGAETQTDKQTNRSTEGEPDSQTRVEPTQASNSLLLCFDSSLDKLNAGTMCPFIHVLHMFL